MGIGVIMLCSTLCSKCDHLILIVECITCSVTIAILKMFELQPVEAVLTPTYKQFNTLVGPPEIHKC